mmetsp:Transcript_68812/g.217600  ORF Transcript_68812/g.217600 Transcript_68812/m.217600 type:complete len:122 (-) Transcript_68812:198-563(-)
MQCSHPKGIVRYDNLMMYSPTWINWMMDGYFELRKDFIRLGLGPFNCPRNVNTGLHAIMMSMHACKRSAAFGISHLENMVNQGHMGDRGHRMSRMHSWGFDTMILRLLKYAGKLEICSGTS